MRPLIAVKLPELRVTCTIGFGPIWRHAVSKVFGPDGMCSLRSLFAAPAASPRSSPACENVSGVSPAVRRLV